MVAMRVVQATTMLSINRNLNTHAKDKLLTLPNLLTLGPLAPPLLWALALILRTLLSIPVEYTILINDDKAQYLRKIC